MLGVRVLGMLGYWARLALPLLVLRVGADHPHDSFALDDLALVANLLYTGPNFHFGNRPIAQARQTARQRRKGQLYPYQVSSATFRGVAASLII